MSFFTAGSGKSMARLLYAVLVFAFTAAMLYLAVLHGTFNAYESAAIATLAGGLSWAWVASKKNRGDGTPGAP